MLQTVECLRNGIGKRLSGCGPYASQPELAVSERPAASGEKNRPSTVHPEGARGYTTNRWKPKKEIPVYIIASVERIASNQRLVTIECAPVPAAPGADWVPVEALAMLPAGTEVHRAAGGGGQTDSAAFDAHVVIEKNNVPVR